MDARSVLLAGPNGDGFAAERLLWPGLDVDHAAAAWCELLA